MTRRVRGHRRPVAFGTIGKLMLPDPVEETNIALVSGALMEEPIRDSSRDGDPVTLLLIGFRPPDETGREYAACVDVEVSDSIADSKRRWLRKGRRLLVLGRLTGDGGIWATAILTEAASCRLQREPRR